MHLPIRSSAGIRFRTRWAGDLTARREQSRIIMDFPARPGEKRPVTREIVEALGITPEAAYKSRDWMVVFPDEQTVRDFRPNPAALSNIAHEKNGLIVTSPGRIDGADFVSRFFAPSLGINEDSVTGSAHCTLVPYCSKRLKKKKLHARQLSKRGGERILISGNAVLFMTGEISFRSNSPG